MNQSDIIKRINMIEAHLKALKKLVTEGENPQDSTRGASTYLVVIMPDGNVIKHTNATDTFSEVIGRMGVERVHECAPDIVGTSESEMNGIFRKHGDYYILVGGKVGDTYSKKRHLKRIAGMLEMELNISTLEKEPVFKRSDV